MNWETLRKICEHNMAYGDYVAKCVYAYLTEHGDGSQEDKQFMNDLIRFLESDSR
jgi:hypothetical protein